MRTENCADQNNELFTRISASLSLSSHLIYFFELNLFFEGNNSKRPTSSTSVLSNRTENIHKEFDGTKSFWKKITSADWIEYKALTIALSSFFASFVQSKEDFGNNVIQDMVLKICSLDASKREAEHHHHSQAGIYPFCI